MTEVALQPLLRRWPNARLASAPLVQPMLFAYLGLMIGIPVTALLAAYNAVVLRRWVLLVVSLLIGIAGWLGFIGVVIALQNTALPIVGGRALYFALGCLLYFLHRRHAQGHLFLGGSLWPARVMYIGAFVILVMMPRRMILALLGLW